MPHEHEEEITSFSIAFGILWILIVPFVVYQLKIFWKSRELPIIKKRRPKLNMLYVMTILFTSAIIRPVLLLIALIDNTRYNEYLFVQAAMTIRTACLFISAVLFLFRTFIITFEFNYNLAVFRKRCLAAVISFNYEYQNWWLSHKKSFGSAKFMSPYVGIILLIQGVIGFILGILNVNWVKLFIFINFIMVVLLYMFTSRYISSHRDQFSVKKEIRYTAMIWIILIVIYGLIFYFPDQWIKIPTQDRDLLLYVFETICTTILMLIRYLFIYL